MAELARFISPLHDKWRLARGSILIEMGRMEEGIAMLHDVQKSSECPIDQAICAAYLAKAHDKNGDSQPFSAASRLHNP